MAGDIVFWGIHPWFLDGSRTLADVRERLVADPRAGVGEIGLDRLRDRTISQKMRDTFVAQLRLAAEFHRPVVLHGAKCWGQVVETIRPFAGRVPTGTTDDPVRCTGTAPTGTTDDPVRCTGTAPSGTTDVPVRCTGSVPAFLFHGFSRSDGLLPDIIRLNGFISVGPAVLNDHAVNYRELVKKIPGDRLLVETDATDESPGSVPALADIIRKVAELRGSAVDELEASLEANADAFVSCLPSFNLSLSFGCATEGKRQGEISLS